eukprot:CAMPEP_0172369626 /NCGR_PEP_ID=MMETSP1060-20121228/33581_1 /TAXON_ID=37318 /ORGANISM="Pseudo-nitzschia pungens, Strain cf. cingulata" /LENGTH=279 /DNA_ID=CAMNT_0013094603 /DNA_START=152 /DNA_END=988 /DNA_ORIENTATION=+
MAINFRKVFRANLDDVENLSYGKGAKKQRGTGSRFTCHRLNRDERHLYDLAKRDGFLTVRGNGYRKERKGSPVWNTHRQRCDALEELCIVVEKRPDIDRVVIDFSTLRVPDDSKLVTFILESVFRSKHQGFYNALISNHLDCKNSDDHQECHEPFSHVFNATHRKINWETVATRPIWGVDERIIAVACERNMAKSIAIDVLRESHSPQFSSLLVDSYKDYSIIAQDQDSTTILSDSVTETIRGENEGGQTELIDTSTVEATSKDRKIIIDSVNIDCIDW